MSEDENKFDEILREKFSSQKFPFDEENWEEAELKIESRRKKEKQRKTAVIFFIGLFAGIAIMFPFVQHESQNSTQIISGLNTGKKTGAPPAIKQTYSQVKPKINSEEKDISNSEQLVAGEPDQNNIKTSNDQNSDFASAKHLSLLEKSIKKGKTVKTKSHAELDLNVSSNMIAYPLAVSSNLTTDTNTIAHNETNEIKSDETENALTHLLNNLKPGNDSSVAVVQVNIPLIEPQPPDKLDAFAFYIDVGATYALGWNNNPGMEGNGINPVLGIGATHFLNHHWAVSSGIQYSGIAHLKQSEKTYTTYIDDFGENKIDSIIAARWIHYVLVPVFLQYDFDNKNSVEIGGSIAHLLTTTSDFIVKTYTDLKDPVETKKKSSGYTEGFNQWDASIGIAYRRKLNDNFTISAEMHYGLSDIRDNSFFAKQLSERSTGIKILISYRLF